MRNEIKAVGRITGYVRDEFGNRNIVLHVSDKDKKQVKFVLDNEPKGIKRNDFVEISGHITAFSYHSQIFEKDSYVQYFVADEMKKAPSILEEQFGLPGKYVENQHIRIILEGKFKGYTVSKNSEEWCEVSVMIDSSGMDKRPNTVKVSCSLNRFGKTIKGLKKDDTVAMIVGVRTPKKEFHGQPVVFENLFALDVFGKKQN